MIIGSSNLTSAALSKNKEWNLKISAHKESYIMRNALEEFVKEFDKATPVTKQWLLLYNEIYQNSTAYKENSEIVLVPKEKILPNSMQKKALNNLQELRSKGANKALLISVLELVKLIYQHLM